MNSKLRGALQILLVAIMIAGFAFVTFVGVGKGHRGSAKNIRLGLDLKGGVSVTYQTTKDDPTEEEMISTSSPSSASLRILCRSIISSR